MESSIVSDDSCLNYVDVDQMQRWNSLYDDLTQPYSTVIGKNTSKKEREQLNLTASTLVYGEISFDGFALAILKIKYKYGLPDVNYTPSMGILQSPNSGVFVDLGSGTGKGVVAASIIHDFEVAYGIEILEGLHTLAVDLISNFNSRGKSKLSSGGRESHTTCSVVHGDMLNLKYKDWRNADVVFANSTCYDDPLMSSISEIAQGMKKGSFFITFTRPVPGEDFDVLEYGLHAMSWGMATVYIHQKKTNPR